MEQFDLNKIKNWTINSLNLIKKENDALLVGIFSGATIELLGRFLLFPNDIDADNGSVRNKHCFYKFIDVHLKKCDGEYIKYGELLWKFLRCEGAHAGLAQSAITLTGDDRDKNNHLKFLQFPPNRRSLYLYIPQFMEDLIWSVEDFFYEIKRSLTLQENCQQVMNKIYQDGQQYICDKKY